jgi:hypothetical protein
MAAETLGFTQRPSARKKLVLLLSYQFLSGQVTVAPSEHAISQPVTSPLVPPQVADPSQFDNHAQPRDSDENDTARALIPLKLISVSIPALLDTLTLNNISATNAQVDIKMRIFFFIFFIRCLFAFFCFVFQHSNCPIRLLEISYSNKPLNFNK